jgi:glycosyltransferase involved in cell wall biosynthesis
MGVKLSIVIPTLGRDSLARTLASCADADEIIIVLDTSRGCRYLPCELPPNAILVRGRYGVTGGHAGRVSGMQIATGTHLAFMDDDDVFNPGAVQLMRDAACDVPVIFRMDHYAHGLLWRDREIRFGNVSTQMYVVPNQPEQFGSWTPHVPGLKEPGGDYTFIKETVEQMGGVVWRNEIISTIRPELSDPLTIAVVTPWHDHVELAEDYFEAVAVKREGDYVLVVDNGSTPPLPFGTIQMSENLGFVGGSNVGLECAETDAVLFLNNDIEMTDPYWLEEIRNALEPGVLVGPLRSGRHADVGAARMPYIDGWCLAGMRDDLLELGGFAAMEEPAYYSDNLLCLEARAAGMTLRNINPGLKHLQNATAGPYTEPAVLAATYANRALYEARARELLAAV